MSLSPSEVRRNEGKDRSLPFYEFIQFDPHKELVEYRGEGEEIQIVDGKFLGKEKPDLKRLFPWLLFELARLILLRRAISPRIPAGGSSLQGGVKDYNFKGLWEFFLLDFYLASLDRFDPSLARGEIFHLGQGKSAVRCLIMHGDDNVGG